MKKLTDFEIVIQKPQNGHLGYKSIGEKVSGEASLGRDHRSALRAVECLLFKMLLDAGKAEAVHANLETVKRYKSLI